MAGRIVVAGLLLLGAIACTGPAGDVSIVPPTPDPSRCVRSDGARAAIGQRVTVCGDVAGASFMPEIGGEPTFINLDRPHPEQTFTVVIWGRNRAKFDRAPEDLFDGAHVCVAGLVERHDGLPQIEVTEPSQMRVC